MCSRSVSQPLFIITVDFEPDQGHKNKKRFRQVSMAYITFSHKMTKTNCLLVQGSIFVFFLEISPAKL